MKNTAFPRRLRLLIFLAGIFFHTTAAAPVAVSPTVAELEELEAVFRQFFNPTQFNLTGLTKTEISGGGSELAGTVSFFGIPSVQLKAQMQDNLKVRQASAIFPASATFQPLQSLSRMVGDVRALRNMLPQSFLLSNELNIQSFTLTLGPDGKSLEAFTTEFVSADWDFMDFGGLKMKNARLTLVVRAESGARKLGGQIRGDLSLAGHTIAVDATLTGNKEDLLIKGTAPQPLKLGQLLESLGGRELRDEFSGMAPGNFTDYIEIPAFSFAVNPYAREFALNAESGVGKQELKVRRNGSKSFFSYIYLPATAFRFGVLTDGLNWLDQAGFQFQDLQMRISNDPSVRRRIVGNPPIGLDVEAAVIPTGETKKMLGNAGAYSPKLSMIGGVDGSLNALLALNNEMNLDLGNGWKYEGVVVYLENKMGSRGPTLGMKGSVVVPIDNTKLRFTLGMSGQPGAASVGGDLLLESINDDGNLKEWREPFGIPYVTFGNLGGSAAVSGSTLIDNIGLKGALKLGSMPRGAVDRRISGEFDAKVDVDVVDSWVKAKLNNFSLLNALQAFDDRLSFPPEVADFLGGKCENVEVDINPQNKKLAIKGTASFYGLSGTFNVDAGKDGFSAGGTMKEVNLKLGDLPLFSLQGANASGPTFTVDLNGAPKIKVNGKAEILGIASANPEILINDKGFTLSAEGKLFDGGLSANVTLAGRDFVNAGEMQVTAAINLGLLSGIRDQIIRSASNSVEREILDALIPTFDLKKVEMGAGLKDIKAKMNFKVDFEVGMFGEKERFRLTVPLQIDLSSPDAFIQSIAEAIGLELLENFNFVEKGYEEFTNAVETAATDVARELEGFGRDVEQGFNDLGGEIASWFEDRTFTAPKSGSALTIVPPGYRHVAVTVSHIKIESDDDASGGEDIYGRIFLDVQGPCIIAPKTNSNFFGVSESKAHEDKEKGEKININKTKHIYVKQGQSVSIILGSEIWEDDTGHDDKFSNGSGRVTINDNTSTEVLSGSWRASDDGSEVSIHYSVKPGELAGRSQMLTAIQSGNFETLKARIRQGGDIRALGSEGVRAAARSHDLKTLVLLQQNGMNADQSMLNDASQNGYDPQVIHQLMEMGATPTGVDVGKAIDNGAYGLALEMIERRGVQPSASQFYKALDAKEYGLAKIILEKGVKPAANDLQTYIEKNDNTAMHLLLAAGAPVEPPHLTAAVAAQNWEVLDLLLVRQKPEPATFARCAALNNTEKFALLCRQGVTLSNSEPARIAVEQNNMDILELCLQNGIPADEVMNYALQRGNMHFVERTVAYGANPNPAIEMAMDRNNTLLLSKLLGEYGANGDQALDKAYARNSLLFVSLVFQNSSPNPNKYLADAANTGKWEMADVMLSYGGDPNLAMTGAIAQAKVDILNRLLTSGASVENVAYIQKASELKSLPMMTALLNAGADPNPGMDQAVQQDQLQAVKLLLENGANPKGFVFLPASRGNENMVRIMLEYGADPNEGIRAAADKLQEPIVRMLLEHGADPKGHMQVPAKQGHLEIVTLLVEYGADPNEGLKASVEGNQYPVANLLISFGAKPNDLVFVAANFRNIPMVELLIQNGDDPQPGMTPAVNYAQFDLLQLLVEKYGVDPTPVLYLRRAVEETDDGSHVKVAEYLLSKGSDPNAYRDPKTDDTLLHIVCGVNRKKDRDHVMVGILIKYKADVHATNNEGWTPLHAAANKGRKNLECVTRLVEAGAEVNACTTKNKSVFQIAEGRDVKEFLKERGAERKCE